MKGPLESLWAIAYTALVWSAAWALLGLLARFTTWLFCLGYGCTP